MNFPRFILNMAVLIGCFLKNKKIMLCLHILCQKPIFQWAMNLELFPEGKTLCSARVKAVIRDHESHLKH